jgi:hypothetical protein
MSPRAQGLAFSVCSITAFVAAACGDTTAAPPAKEAPEEMVQLGVLPHQLDCDTLAPPAELSALLGGPIERVDSEFEPPRGVPKPCQYAVLIDAPPPAEPPPGADGDEVPDGPLVQAFSFDLDCRAEALEKADRLMAQYAARRSLNPDGTPGPEPTPVPVGRKAMDHNGSAILFVDDDTPCYVRVNGPDPERRLALAQLVERRLTERTAPTMNPVFRRASAPAR